jgi:hypothetical protein
MSVRSLTADKNFKSSIWHGQGHPRPPLLNVLDNLDKTSSESDPLRAGRAVEDRAMQFQRARRNLWYLLMLRSIGAPVTKLDLLAPILTSSQMMMRLRMIYLSRFGDEGFLNRRDIPLLTLDALCPNITLPKRTPVRMLTLRMSMAMKSLSLPLLHE